MPALVYDPGDEQVRFLMRWRYTVFPMVFKDPMFWLLMGIHAWLLYEEKRSVDSGELGWPKLDWRAALVPTSLLTFFVVFYGGNCYTRFYQLHGQCMGISSCITEWAYLVQHHFGDQPTSVRWNLMRLMLGAMHTHYAFLGGEGAAGMLGDESKAITDNEWRAIRKHNYLSREEIADIEAYKGSRFFLPVIWALSEVRAALKMQVKASKPPGLTPPNAPPEPSEHAMLLTMPAVAAIHNRFESTALEFRRHCSGTLALLRMPVPFAYFHVLKLLLLVSLSIVGYALLEIEQHQYGVSLIMYAVICMILIGMQAIAVAMSDPFGDDDTDFDIEIFMEDSNDNAIAILLNERSPLYTRFPREDLTNPLDSSLDSLKARSWSAVNDGYGLIDDRETPQISLRDGASSAEAAAHAAASFQIPLLGSISEESAVPAESAFHEPLPAAPVLPPGSKLPKAGAYVAGAYAYATAGSNVRPPGSSPSKKGSPQRVPSLPRHAV